MTSKSEPSDQLNEAKRLLKLRTAALGMVAHELRTPLGRVLAGAELISLLDSLQEIHAAAKEIATAAEIMKAQLNDLAVYAELNGASPRLVEDDLNVHDVLSGIIRDQERQSSTCGTVIHARVDPAIPYRLPIDPVRFRQIAENLISNALQASKGGEVLIKLSIEDASDLLLEVADSGPGIPDSEKEIIWEPYRQGSKPSGKSGLGLAIVKLATTQVRGTIELESVWGQGARFIVRIPIDGSGKGNSSPT